jgi:hypothetical protein
MPNVVKGSKQEKMVVVPYRPWRRLALGLGMCLLFAGSVAGGYWYGIRDAADFRIEVTALRQQVSEIEGENASLRQQVANLDRTIVMDRQTNDEIQDTIAELREYTGQLEQDNAFYRQAMTSEFEDVGLVIGQIELQRADEPGRYRYKLVMRQEESGGEYLTGHVNVNLVGEQAGRRQVVALRDISEDQELLDIRLRFRYFQDIEGELALPEGFEPRQIDIDAFATAPMAKSVSKSYDWVVKGE